VVGRPPPAAATDDEAHDGGAATAYKDLGVSENALDPIDL
jgi:hypothetical protein